MLLLLPLRTEVVLLVITAVSFPFAGARRLTLSWREGASRSHDELRHDATTTTPASPHLSPANLTKVLESRLSKFNALDVLQADVRTANSSANLTKVLESRFSTVVQRRLDVLQADVRDIAKGIGGDEAEEEATRDEEEATRDELRSHDDNKPLILLLRPTLANLTRMLKSRFATALDVMEANLKGMSDEIGGVEKQKELETSEALSSETRQKIWRKMTFQRERHTIAAEVDALKSEHEKNSDLVPSRVPARVCIFWIIVVVWLGWVRDWLEKARPSQRQRDAYLVMNVYADQTSENAAGESSEERERVAQSSRNNPPGVQRPRTVRRAPPDSVGFGPAFACAVGIMLLTAVAIAFYVWGWLVWSKYGDVPCDQPLKAWLLLQLLLPPFFMRVIIAPSPGMRPVVNLVMVCAILSGAWISFSCKTCQVTNPQLYGYCHFFFMFLVVAFHFVFIHMNREEDVWIINDDPFAFEFVPRHGLIHEIATVPYNPKACMAQPSQCCVCHEDFALDDALKKTVCGHFFHEECLGNWFGTRAKTCPLCRTDLEEVRNIEGPVEEHRSDDSAGRDNDLSSTAI